MGEDISLVNAIRNIYREKGEGTVLYEKTVFN
jgi:hypothetical protein